MTSENTSDKDQAKALNKTVVRRSFTQGDKVKIETDDFRTIYGEFHRYGASRYGAIIFVNGVMRFVDEQSLNYA
jgi:hypothetical protein